MFPARAMGSLPAANVGRGRQSPLQDLVATSPAPASRSTEPRQGIVEARLLGTFELSIDGRVVEKWTGQRGRSVLRYLLSRRRHTCSRDELLAVFWPDVAPGAVRNRLQVAVSGLRRTLREVTNLHVIEYAEGGYRINPGLRSTWTWSASRRRCRRPAAPSGPVISTAETTRLYQAIRAGSSGKPTLIA